jgi:hypothetical protein
VSKPPADRGPDPPVGRGRGQAHRRPGVARHAQLDYMIAQQRQQQVAAALEAIVGSEEDRFKAAASKIEDSAHRAIEEQDRRTRPCS